MTLKLVILLFFCYFFMDEIVMAGGHSRVRPSSKRPLKRPPQSYDDIVVVESPIIDLDDYQRVPRPVTPSRHQVSGQYYTEDDAHGSPLRYDGPMAVPMLLPDGTLADTPEVAAARTAHLNALEQARTLASIHDDDDDGSYDPLKYEYDEHVPHHTGQVLTRHRQYSGVEAVQGPLNNPYQRPLSPQTPFNGQHYSMTGHQHLVNGPVRQNYPINKQQSGPHGYNEEEHKQSFAPRLSMNKHHLEQLAARGLLNRQDIDTLIAEHPENKGYLEQLSYQLPPDNYYTDTMKVRGQPLHDVSMHNGNRQYFTPVKNQIMSHNEPTSPNPLVLRKPAGEQYPNVVAVQPFITNVMYDKTTKKSMRFPNRKNGEHVHTTAQHASEQYSNVVAESPIKGSVGIDAIIKEVVGYSATYNGPKAEYQESQPQYSNLPVQSTLDNPVDPNFIYKNTHMQITHSNRMDVRFDQHPVNNYVDNTHYVPAPTHLYTKPNDDPQAQVYQESIYLSDTPEVAAAKAAHFTAHQIARENHAKWIASYQSHHRRLHQDVIV